jgi:hypothetical protein
MKRWCVRHRNGWCATATGKPFPETRDSVKTACGYFVILPGGCEFREPDCKECKAKTHGSRRKS